MRKTKWFTAAWIDAVLTGIALVLVATGGLLV